MSYSKASKAACLGVVGAMAMAATLILPFGVASARAASFAYVGNSGDHTISQYRLDAGLLAPLHPPTAAVGASPRAVVVSAHSKSVYIDAANDFESPGSVWQYHVRANGTLTPKAPASVATGINPSDVALSPNGKSLYVGNDGDDGAEQPVPPSISQFNVGPGGALSPKHPASVRSCFAADLAVSPNGKSLYEAAGMDEEVCEFDIGPSGKLKPKAAQPYVQSAGPTSVALSPNGNNAYVANGSSASISQYRVRANGTLRPKHPLKIATHQYPEELVVERDGKSLYAVGGGVGGAAARVSQYTIGRHGRLRPKHPASITTGEPPRGAALSPRGRSFYVVAGGVVWQYRVRPDGTLAHRSPSTIPAGHGPVGIALAHLSRARAAN